MITNFIKDFYNCHPSSCYHVFLSIISNCLLFIYWITNFSTQLLLLKATAKTTIELNVFFTLRTNDSGLSNTYCHGWTLRAFWSVGLRKKNSELKQNHYQCTMGIWAAPYQPIYSILSIELRRVSNKWGKLR